MGLWDSWGVGKCLALCLPAQDTVYHPRELAIVEYSLCYLAHGVQ